MHFLDFHGSDSAIAEIPGWEAIQCMIQFPCGNCPVYRDEKKEKVGQEHNRRQAGNLHCAACRLSWEKGRDCNKGACCANVDVLVKRLSKKLYAMVELIFKR